MCLDVKEKRKPGTVKYILIMITIHYIDVDF